MRGRNTEITNLLKDKGALSGGDIFTRDGGYQYDDGPSAPRKNKGTMRDIMASKPYTKWIRRKLNLERK